MTDTKLSVACEDCLEAALTKLAATQCRLGSTLDALLLKLPPRTSHHYPSSSVQSPLLPPSPMPTPPPLPTLIQSRPTPLSTLLPTLTSSPMPTLPSMPPLLPMPTSPSCPAPVQPSLPPLSGPLPRSTLHLPTFGHVRATIPISDNLFSAILRCDHTIAPHAKHGEHQDIALFELGPGFFGTIMVSHKCIPIIFALWTGAKLSEFYRNRPWDPGITFGSHGLKSQHLEDKVFLMGREM
ncbi:hypothetical protein GmHk_03G007914 [Glycine max]|nr:hypothetical protein GmHk_03G007914 [Glycine max]